MYLYIHTHKTRRPIKRCENFLIFFFNYLLPSYEENIREEIQEESEVIMIESGIKWERSQHVLYKHLDVDYREDKFRYGENKCRLKIIAF